MTGYGRWRKSTRSGGGDDSSCVEARRETGAFQVRDSKLGHDSPIFDLSATDFKALLGAAELIPHEPQGRRRDTATAAFCVGGSTHRPGWRFRVRRR
ncbi:DUF397 domain-containing protein [Glycomyces paridis]|uniref:DUF397 domain-containing protein n=2 Tax=Glycomyces paridis TaxID=2126555 RepID=A0A4S8P2S7_9ACTN|nr:DUF397 domain-containing protein [Glycomyces paridis]THV23601.1 DUF397 domain-containing protein [Glycomyces paridis]